MTYILLSIITILTFALHAVNKGRLTARKEWLQCVKDNKVLLDKLEKYEPQK